MSTAVTQDQRAKVIELAQSAVFGVVNARLRKDADDSALVIMEYMREAIGVCGEDTTAWSMIFSAAVVHLTDAIELLAAEHHQSPAAELSDFALAHALDTV